ncbi:hypothetical protein ACO2RV_16970 [Ancylobacter sp. VNQ12]|uniref:hypothetical protein n=1 Tax=Ancylobacter sp. VNQ12 TaxID=3400920 RepID=UPI003BFD02DC
MTTELISFKDLRPVAPGEMGILDLALAKALGFERLRDIRKIIERHADELRTYGSLCENVIHETAQDGAVSTTETATDGAVSSKPARRGGKRGPIGKEFVLNEHQALVVSALSRTPNAAIVRKALIETFFAFRRGRAAVSTTLPDMTQRAVRHRRMIRDAKIDFARVVARLDDLGIDVASIDMGAVRTFSRQFSITTH